MAFASFDREDFRFVTGEPEEYQSSEHVIRTRCGTCGSPIEWRIDKHPERMVIALGLLDDAGDIEVNKDYWQEHQVSWAITHSPRE